MKNTCLNIKFLIVKAFSFEKHLASWKDDLSRLFVLVLICGFAISLLYFVLSNVFFYPVSGAYGGREVFLLPRYYLQQNDLTSGVFHEWGRLVFFGGVIGASFWFAIKFLERPKLPLKYFIVGLYFTAIVVELSFVGLTYNGFSHIRLQAKSINNGIWYSLNYLSTLPQFSGVSLLEKLRYTFTVLGGNNSGYTIPGTTHPPGIFVLFYPLFKFVSLFKSPALVWGLVMMLLNTLLLPVIALMARRVMSERNARLSSIMLLVTPSLVMHFCSMLDVSASFVTAVGYLALLLCLWEIGRDGANARVWPLGLLTGLAFTLAAQITYGHAIPILAALVAFYYVSRNMVFCRKTFYLTLFIAPVLYFAAESWFSGGTSFYPVRAWKIAQLVKSGLNSRPYPLSQFANLTIMAVMGGFLYLPAMINSVVFAVRVALGRRNLELVPQVSSRFNGRLFLSITAICISLFLVMQSTVRLEVERTWHWAFIPGWTLGGICLISAATSAGRLFRKPRSVAFSIRFLGWTQLFITLALAISIQDYY